jgi:membrane-associated phospholipid phosphatase
MRRPSWGYKLTLLCLFAAGYAVWYVWPNFRPLFPPTFLPLFWVDRTVPFLPWTFTIYLSDYLLFVAIFFLIDDLDEWNSFARMAFGTLILCGTVFLFYPTTYPRPEYPVVENPIVAFLMGLIADGDTPNNCFPSMHVAMTSMGTWTLRKKHPGIVLFFALWTAAIIFSTLTTKQHYLLDIIGGLTVVVIIAWLDSLFVAGGWKNHALAKAFATRRTS